MKSKYLKRFFIAVLLMVTMCTNTMVALADETEDVVVIPERPNVLVESYEISHDRIIPGDSFTLSLQIKNYATKETAYGVMVNITNPKGVAPAYGTVSQMYLGDIAPQESKKISFEYDSWTTITGETLDFSITLSSVSNANTVTLRVPAGTESMFGILDINMATQIYAKDTTTASLSFRVLGEENVGNIELRAEYNGTTIGSSQVGNVTAGMTKTQSISFGFGTEGEYVVDFYFDYVSEDGVRQTEFIGSKKITVERANMSDLPQTGDDPTVDQSGNYDNITILVFGGLLILAIFVVAVAIMKKKR